MIRKDKEQVNFSKFREELFDLVDRSIHFFEERIVMNRFLPSKVKDACFYALIGKFDNFADLNREVGCVSNFVDVFLTGVEFAKDKNILNSL